MSYCVLNTYNHYYIHANKNYIYIYQCKYWIQMYVLKWSNIKLEKGFYGIEKDE